MNCEICKEVADTVTWVRPVAGGRRRAHRFCCEACKETGLRALALAGYEETHAVLGWDVFVPIWSDDV